MREGKKVPAHEAILDGMDSIITELRRNGVSAVVEACLLNRIHGFVCVLRRMIIPEKHRTEIVDKLLQFKEESCGSFLSVTLGELAEHLSIRKLSHVGELMDLVRASTPPDPSHPGPVVIQATLWDERTVKASYTDDAESDDELGYLIERLLLDGEPFVTTVTDTDDLVCVLKWTIE